MAYWQYERSFRRDLKSAKRNGAPQWLLNPIANKYLQTKHLWAASKNNSEPNSVRVSLYDSACRQLAELNVLFKQIEDQRISGFTGHDVK
jgi:hypothetical protein